MLTVVFLAGVLATAWFLVPFLLRLLAERRLQRLCRDRRAIVLSYDDGPSAPLTPRLLDLLRDHDVRASFFLLGRNAEVLPDLVGRLVRDGHEVGSHTHNHANAWKTDPLTAARDLRRGLRTLEQAGVRARWFRPPFGKLTLWGLIDGARLGLRYAWWTVDSRDSWDRRPVDAVLAEIGRKGGGVVLMHDVEPTRSTGAATPHGEHVLTLTHRIIELARAEGYALLRLGDLAEGEPAVAARPAA